MHPAVAVTDALGRVTVLSYEHADPYKITKVTDPFGRSAVFAYNAAGQLAGITDVIGLTSTFNYGGDGYLTSVHGSGRGRHDVAHLDAYGRPGTVTGADGYAITLDYDALDRVTNITYPDTTFEETTYDRLHVSPARSSRPHLARLRGCRATAHGRP